MSNKYIYLGSSIPSSFFYSGSRGNATSRAVCAREEYFFESIEQIAEIDRDEILFLSTALTNEPGFHPRLNIHRNSAKCIVTATHHILLFKKALQFIGIFSTLYRNLDKNTIVVVYNAAPLFTFVLMLLFFRKYLLVLEVEDFFKKNTFKYLLHKFFFSVAVRLADLITLSSLGQLKYLDSKRTSAKVIFNSGYVLSLSATKPSNNLINNGRVKILYCGSLERERGLPDLLKAFSILKERHINLIITGHGPLQNHVNHVASLDPRITYLGLLPNDKFHDLLNNSDILINPQNIDISENFPSKVTAALSFGLQVISTESVGVSNSHVSQLITFYDGSFTQLVDRISALSQVKLSFEEKIHRRDVFLKIMLNQSVALKSEVRNLRSNISCEHR